MWSSEPHNAQLGHRFSYPADDRGFQTTSPRPCSGVRGGTTVECERFLSCKRVYRDCTSPDGELRPPDVPARVEAANDEWLSAKVCPLPALVRRSWRPAMRRWLACSALSLVGSASRYHEHAPLDTGTGPGSSLRRVPAGKNGSRAGWW